MYYAVYTGKGGLVLLCGDSPIHACTTLQQLFAINPNQAINLLGHTWLNTL